jgi:hypothetical protein
MTTEQREAMRRLVWEIQNHPESGEARARMAALLETAGNGGRAARRGGGGAGETRAAAS